MNKLPHEIVKVIKPPYQRIDDEYCCWEAVVLVNCYGYDNEETVRAVSKEDIEVLTRIGRTYDA